ncbi:MAG TPA: NUDIX domain-containing protein [Candidatus Saccharimonadales bacterium]|nr:NUDIX domain-containing protein [Candidatus Saccharimonadales bacterium]
MNDKFKVIPSVFIAVISDGKVILTKRKNTSFMDGFYDLPSGHVEEGESIKDAAVRELKEETGVDVEPKELELFNITQGYSSPGRPYLYMMFKTEKFDGNPSLTEPEFSDEVAFFGLNDLPNRTIPHVKEALAKMDGGISFGYVAEGAYDDL